MEMIFTAVFEKVAPADGGGYVAYTEELPGAVSEGDSIEEARDNLRDAIGELLQANRELTAGTSAGKSIIRERLSLSLD